MSARWPMSTRALGVTAIADLRRLGRDRALDRLGHRLGPAAQVSRRALEVDVARSLGDLRVEARVGTVLFDMADRGRRRLAEAGADEPGLHDDDADAEALDLEAQRVADGLHRVLGRVVEAAAREGEVRAHRGHVHDPARALRAHRRQHELAHAHEAEDVGLELAAHLVEGDALDRARLAVAGVVDQRADGSVLGLDRAYRLLHRGLVGDVERQQPAAPLLEVGDRLRPPRAGVDGMAALREVQRGGAADARRASGHEDGVRGRAVRGHGA
jgi:hypothetical protein